MPIYTVKRIINGKSYLKDEDRIVALNWDMAFHKLASGLISGRFDNTCEIQGELVYEESITVDNMLDIMIEKIKH